MNETITLTYDELRGLVRKAVKEALILERVDEISGNNDKIIQQ